MKKQYKSILIYSGIALVLVNPFILYLFKDLNPLAFRSFIYGGIPVQILAYVLVALYFQKKSK